MFIAVTPGYQSVRQFIRQAYRLINPSNPTQPLHGDDLSLGIEVLNQLLQSYAGPGLLITIAQTINYPLSIGQMYVTFGPSTFVPTPDVTVGRLATANNAWLLLNGVTYPLIAQERDEFLQSYKYLPLQGLPRFAIYYPDIEIMTMQVYPAPSQFFELYVRGKFQLPILTSDDDMSIIPQYYVKYLLFAAAKDIALYKGRSQAWTPPLEAVLQDQLDMVLATSEINVAITGDRESMLNGNWRTMSGI